MNLPAYLYTLNKNNSYHLDTDEMKDVQQELTIYLSDKNYNDLLTKKTAVTYYRRACKRKVSTREKTKQAAGEAVYLDTVDQQNPADSEEASRIEQQRLQALDRLVLKTSIQKKIMQLLIAGLEYPDVRKKLHLNERQLRNNIYQIRQQNAARAR